MIQIKFNFPITVYHSIFVGNVPTNYIWIDGNSLIANYNKIYEFKGTIVGKLDKGLIGSIWQDNSTDGNVYDKIYFLNANHEVVEIDGAELVNAGIAKWVTTK